MQKPCLSTGLPTEITCRGQADCPPPCVPSGFDRCPQPWTVLAPPSAVVIGTRQATHLSAQTRTSVPEQELSARDLAKL